MSPPSPSPTPHDAANAVAHDGAAPDGWSALGPSLRAALSPGRDTHDLATDVLAAIEGEGTLGPALRVALTPHGEVDLVDVVYAAIEREAHDTDVGDAVRAALAPQGAVDVTDDVLTAIAQEDDATLGEAIRSEALRVRHLIRRSEAPLPAIRLEDAVYAQMHAAEPEGWDADALRQALAPRADVDVAEGVMAHVTGASGRPLLQVLKGGPAPEESSLRTRVAPLAPRRTARHLLAWAAAAAVVLAIWRPTLPTRTPTAEATVAAVDLQPARPLAAVNDAHVEALATGATVTAQVMQFEDGGPTIIMVEEL